MFVIKVEVYFWNDTVNCEQNEIPLTPVQPRSFIEIC